MPLAAAAAGLVSAVGGAGAAATLGSAVIGAGASLYGASKQSKAAKRANAAQQQAAQQSLAAQQANFDRIYGLNQGFVSGGQTAFDQLLSELLPQGGQRPTQGRQTAPGGGYGKTATGGGMARPMPASGGTWAGQRAFGPDDGAIPAAGGRPDPTQQEVQAGWNSIGFNGAYPAAGGFQMGQGAPQAQPGPDWQAYGEANPDLGTEWQRLQASGEAQSRFGGDPNQFLQFHYQNYGQQEGRQLPMQAAPQQEALPQEQFAPQQADGPPAWDDPAHPPQFSRPAGPSAPDLGGYFTNFEADPSYKWRLNQGLDAVNAKFAARGLLRSGGGAKGLNDYAQGAASQEYGNWFNRGLQRAQLDQNAYQFDANRNDRNFLDDRSYGTNLWQAGVNRADDRTDTRTRNLFGLAGIGQSAAGAVAGAGTNFANAQQGIYGDQANATSAAAQARANAAAYGFGGVARAAQGVLNRFGSSGFGGGSGGYQSDVGNVNFGNVGGQFGNYRLGY